MTVLTSPNGPGVTRDTGFPTAERLLPDRGSLAVWGDVDGTALVCRRVLDVTHDVRTFLFEPEQPALFRYEPGQFLTLTLQVDGRPVRRCYTISTPPTRPHVLGITVKRQPGGLVSNWLHDTMAPGQRVEAEGPFGTFTPVRHPADKYLFLSGGSGITPFMSMTRTLYDLGSDVDVVFVHSARTPSDIVFRRELESMAAALPSLRVVPVCERDAPREPWSGLRGLLGAAMLQLVAPDLADRVVFCCGPAPYMAAVRRILGDVGFDLRNYHEESFSFGDLPAEQPPEPVAPTTTTATTFSVEFVRSGRTVTCGADETVLDAAWAAGLTPPSSCGQGLCGTCKTTALSGSVDMRHQGGIRPREIAQDKILLCCSTPKSDLSLDA